MSRAVLVSKVLLSEALPHIHVHSPEAVDDVPVAMETGSNVRMGVGDRRRRARLPLQLPVQFYRSETQVPIEGTTKDMSSEGFYCLSRASFTPGESLLCSIECPAYAPDLPERKLVITCRVRVIRTIPEAVHGFHGVACRIKDFECSYLK